MLKYFGIYLIYFVLVQSDIIDIEITINLNDTESLQIGDGDKLNLPKITVPIQINYGGTNDSVEVDPVDISIIEQEKKKFETEWPSDKFKVISPPPGWMQTTTLDKNKIEEQKTEKPSTIDTTTITKPIGVIGDAFKISKYEKFCFDTYYPSKSNNAGNVAVTTTKPDDDEYLYMANIGWNKTGSITNEIQFIYSGIIISKNFVLTSAHSTGNVMPDYIRIINKQADTKYDPIYDIPVEQVFIHPNYTAGMSSDNDDGTLYNDIALIKVTFDLYEKPACLWYQHELQSNIGEAFGFSMHRYHDRTSHSIEHLTLPINSNEQCQKYYNMYSKQFPNGVSSDKQFCAGNDQNAMNISCPGISGGPIVQKIGTIPYVIGVSSFGVGCNGLGPTVYTRISAYLDWIESIVWST